MSDVIDINGKLYWKGEFRLLRDIISQVTPEEAPAVIAEMKKTMFRVELIQMCIKAGYDPAELLVTPVDEETPETPTIKVGMGATLNVGSDNYPATVVSVSQSGLFAKIQRDQFTRIDDNGQSESQEYTFKYNPDGEVLSISLRGNGQWRVKGRNGTLVTIGTRRAYQDPSF